MKRSEKAVLAVILSAVMFIGGTVAVTAAAGVWGYVPFTFTTNGSGEEVVEGFNSTGRIVYIEPDEPDHSIIIDNADLVTLAKATNQLNTQFTDSLAAAVNNIGSVPKTDRVVAGEATFSDLLTAIKDSQKIPTDQTYSGTKPDSNDTETGNISAASEANLSLGTAAWVDGKLIVGTGADNNSYYASGQDKLIQNAGGHIHNSSCKKLTCTMYITGKPGNYWISHSDYMEWRYLVCHQNCGRAASEHSAHYGNPGAGECPCTAQYTIPAGSHTYWSCGY